MMTNNENTMRDELASAAACYALSLRSVRLKCALLDVWPWARFWWKPDTLRAALVDAVDILNEEIRWIDHVED